jgi:hypothetical protein
MPKTCYSPQAAAGIGVWLACLVWIGTQWDSAMARCTRLWAMLCPPQEQALVLGATPGLQVQTRTFTHPGRRQIVAVAVDAAGCIRYAGATESALPEEAALRIYLRPVLQGDPPRDCMSEPLP